MFKFSFLTIKSAVANQGEVMETRDHFKNGASSKSQTSRIWFLSYFFIAAFAVSAVFTSCGDDNDNDNDRGVVKLVETMVINWGYGDITAKFEYDDENRIVKTYSYWEGELVGVTTFIYSGEDLVKIESDNPDEPDILFAVGGNIINFVEHHNDRIT